MATGQKSIIFASNITFKTIFDINKFLLKGILILLISTGKEPYAIPDPNTLLPHERTALLNRRVRNFQQVTVRLGLLPIFPVKDPANPIGQNINLNARVSHIILNTILSLLQIDPPQRPAALSDLLALPW